MAKKKFDTNPLDPTFPDRIREAETAALPKQDHETREFAPPSITEEQTRRFENQEFNNYQSPFSGQNVPANFRTAKLGEINDSKSRKVSKIGLPENILTALPYIPFYVGLIAGLIVLLLVPKSETKARFHAAQGLAAHIGIFIVTAILGIADNFVPFASSASNIFQIVTMVMLIIFAVKAFQGKPIHIEAVDDLTEWLEEKIKPQN
ncbi:MAG: hypothetical protein LH472_07780 [Pyrinomonadaceae bacterium]|nr:hypothetical protein [Pyrinomonadaceae bacterium]